MFSSWLITLAMAALVMFVLFRRARRLFGRQKYSTRSLGIRVGLFVGVCTMLMIPVSIARGSAPWGGLGLGIVIGLVGIYLTRFESIEGELYFKPNAYVGAAVLSLFIGRMLYRLTGAVAIAETFRSMQDDPASVEGIHRSPMASGVLFVVLGFYICYYAAVLIRGYMLQADSARA